MRQPDGLCRVAGVWLLAVGMGVAQVTPPACPVRPGDPPVSAAARAARPTAEQINATAAAAAADPTMMLAAEPMANFGTQRFRREDYAECGGSSGCYWADLDAQTKRAEAALDRVIATAKAGEKLAMVLDIDETSLSSFCELRREDYGFLLDPYSKWLVSPDAALAIPGTLRLFNKARAAGVDVFFITGRAEEMTDATARNLTAAGYQGWKGLALRKGPQKTMATVEYKSQERRKIVDAGYRIVMSMGDQWSDLNGDPKAEVSVKLPNPFYYLP